MFLRMRNDILIHVLRSVSEQVDFLILFTDTYISEISSWQIWDTFTSITRYSDFLKSDVMFTLISATCRPITSAQVRGCDSRLNSVATHDDAWIVINFAGFSHLFPDFSILFIGKI